MKTLIQKIIYLSLIIIGSYHNYQGHINHNYNQLLFSLAEYGLALWLMHYPIGWLPFYPNINLLLLSKAFN